MSGFSVSTVSKALNDKQDISVETRKMIKGIAKKCNYIPNNYAVALRSKKTQSIAVVLPEVTKKSYSQALCYLQKKASEFGYRVMLYQTFDSKDKEVKYVNSLNDGSTDGIVVISNSVAQKSNYKNGLIPLTLLDINESLSLEEIKQRSCHILKGLLGLT